MLTDHCNMHCPHCGRHSGERGHASKEVVSTLLEQAASRRFWKVNLTGGEPLLHPQIGEIIAGLRDANVRVSLNTNGALLEEKIEVVKRANSVSISLDGRRDTHDASRRTGAFDAALGAMRALAAAGVPFNITFSIGENTAPEDIATVLETAGGHRAPVTFQPGQLFVLGASDPNPNAPAPEAFRALMRTIIEIKKNKPGSILNSLAGLRHLLRWPEDTAIPCGAGRFFCRIDPLGNVFSCSNSLAAAADPVGNITRRDIEEIFADSPRVSCAQCWCAARVEANLIFGLRPGAIINYLRTRAGFNL
jgi:MoaA/NifB/PqqE/SkfB family radical SAM enzyme